MTSEKKMEPESKSNLREKALRLVNKLEKKHRKLGIRYKGKYVERGKRKKRDVL